MSIVKKFFKFLWFLFGVFIAFVLVVIASLIIRNEDRPPPVPPVPFYQQELTPQTVKTIVENLVRTGGIQKPSIKIKVLPYWPTDNPDDHLIQVHYRLFRPTQSSTARTAMYVWEALFKHPKVSRVWVWEFANLVDRYGRVESRLIFRASMGRELADRIVDWRHVRDRASLDFNRFLDFVEVNFLHPVLR